MSAARVKTNQGLFSGAHHPSEAGQKAENQVEGRGAADTGGKPWKQWNPGC